MRVAMRCSRHAHTLICHMPNYSWGQSCAWQSLTRIVLTPAPTPRPQQVIESHGALEGLIDILADSNTPQVVLQQAARSLGSICWRLPALFRKVAQLGVMQKVRDLVMVCKA